MKAVPVTDPINNKSILVNFEDVYMRYNEVTASFRLSVIVVFFVICVVSVNVFAVIILSSRYVRVWTHHLVCTYSLVAADLWTTLLMMASIATSVNLSPGLLNSLNEMCVPVILEALRLGAMLCTLLHVMLLAWQHLLAFYPPMTCNRAVKGIIGKGLILVWLMPSALSVSVFLTVGRSSYGCFDNAFLTDSFRSVVVSIMSLPILVTFVLYIFLVVRMHYKARRDILANRMSTAMVIAQLDRSSPVGNMDGHGVLNGCVNVRPSFRVSGCGGGSKLTNRPASESRLNHLHQKYSTSVDRQPRPERFRPLLSSSASTSQSRPGASMSLVMDGQSRISVTPSTFSTSTSIAARPAAIRRRKRTTFFALTLMILFLASWVPTMVWFSLLCQQCPYPQIVLMIEQPWALAIGSALTNLPLYLRLPVNAWLYAFRLPDIRCALLRMQRKRRQHTARNQNCVSEAAAEPMSRMPDEEAEDEDDDDVGLNL